METTAKRVRVSTGACEMAGEKVADCSSSADFAGQIIEGLPDHLAMECLARVPLSSMHGVSQAWQSLIYDPHFQSLRALHGASQLDWVYTLVQSADNTFKWRAFDPFAARWHDLPPPPHPMEFQLSNPDCIGVSYSVQCASSATKLVMVSALKARKDGHPRMTLEPALDHPYIFDTRTCSWKQGSPFSVPRKWCVCGVSGGSLYVASGSGKEWDRELSKSVEAYNLVDNKWENRRSLSSSKFSGEAMSAVTSDGKLYFVSGRGVFSKDGVVYDVANDLWSEMAPGLKKGWTGPAVAVNGKFYLLETPAGKLKVYSPEEDEWKTVMVDAKLQSLEHFVAMKGKIVAIEAPVKGSDASAGGRFVRVIDVASEVPRIFDIPVEEGRVVSVQGVIILCSKVMARRYSHVGLKSRNSAAGVVRASLLKGHLETRFQNCTAATNENQPLKRTKCTVNTGKLQWSHTKSIFNGCSQNFDTRLEHSPPFMEFEKIFQLDVGIKSYAIQKNLGSFDNLGIFGPSFAKTFIEF